MARAVFCFAVVAVTAFVGLARGADSEVRIPPPERILDSLRAEHPRLMLTAKRIESLKQQIDGNRTLAGWYSAVRESAEKMLDQGPSVYEIPDGRRLLSVSRRVKDRVRTLAFVYQISGRKQFADRAWQELAAAAAFEDWNPTHFLDTAEMTHALAIGYDWLYDVWTPDQRLLLQKAIVDKGLTPAAAVYQKGRGWPQNENNWNQVCNGGIGLGALALADVEPELAGQLLHSGLESLPLAMQHYAPDGAGTEGVTYWDYGSRYNILLLDSLETALGTDFGLSGIAGFAQSGDYSMYMSGAARYSFNFGDCGYRRMSTPQHFWLAGRFDQPRHSWYRLEELQGPKAPGSVLDLLWYCDNGSQFNPATLALDKHFRRAECASMRSSWTDPNAIVVGIMAGQNAKNSHRHLELGSFILEAAGVRWFVDLGSEHETYMSHRHDNGRYDYYRTRAEGNNTLVINPRRDSDQRIDGEARIVRFESTPNRSTAEIDLTSAYKDSAKSVRRTIEMIDRRRVQLCDEVTADRPVDVWSFLHTQAKVDLASDGRTATLSQSGKRLTVKLLEPAGAAIRVMEAVPLPTSPNPKPSQADNRGTRKLAVRLDAAQKTRMVWTFTADTGGPQD